jgi:hypothetical protein
MTAASPDPVSVSVSVSHTLFDLQRDYPAWCFSVRYRGDVPHVEAVRPQAPAGLVCVITDDPAELRSELDSAA